MDVKTLSQTKINLTVSEKFSQSTTKGTSAAGENKSTAESAAFSLEITNTTAVESNSTGKLNDT